MNGAARGFKKPSDHAHRGALARAVRPEEPEHLSRGNLEINALNGVNMSESLFEFRCNDPTRHKPLQETACDCEHALSRKRSTYGATSDEKSDDTDDEQDHQWKPLFTQRSVAPERAFDSGDRPSEWARIAE